MENRCCSQLESHGLTCRWASVGLPHRGSAGLWFGLWGLRGIRFAGAVTEHRNIWKNHLGGSPYLPQNLGAHPMAEGMQLCALGCAQEGMEVPPRPPTNWPNYGTN